MPKAPELPVRLFKTMKSWESWLAKNWASSPGLWLRFAKKNTPLKSITYLEAVEGALCHGWIDGQVKRFDEVSFIQRFTPRQPRSIWSKINRDKANRLIEEGRMGPGGHSAIERARQNGNWDRAYDSYRTIQVPDDLAKRLKRNKKAAERFASLNRHNRYAVLFRLQTARTPAVRAERMKSLIALLAEGKTPYPQAE